MVALSFNAFRNLLTNILLVLLVDISNTTLDMLFDSEMEVYKF